MEYQVRFVEDSLLLVAGHQLDWMLCNQRADGVTLCIRAGVRTMSDEDAADVLETAWRAWQEMNDGHHRALTA